MRLLAALLLLSSAPAAAAVDLYAPVYTYHMPYAYSPALRRTYNDVPLGVGLGKDGVFAMEFADSHDRPQYNAGYAWLPTWRPFGKDVALGAGLAGLIIARSDIRRYTPFPAVLPLGSVAYRGVALQTTFIPGANVVFTWLKLSLF